MDSTDLATFIATHTVAAELIHLADHTPTVETAAQALNVSVEQIVKSILFLAEGSPLLVIANGLRRIDYRRLSEYLHLSRRQIKMAEAAQVFEIAGYPIGAMPPFGHQTRLRTLIDHHVFDQPEIFAGGGAINALLRITPAEIARVTGGVKVEITQTSR